MPVTMIVSNSNLPLNLTVATIELILALVCVYICKKTNDLPNHFMFGLFGMSSSAYGMIFLLGAFGIQNSVLHILIFEHLLVSLTIIIKFWCLMTGKIKERNRDSRSRNFI